MRFGVIAHRKEEYKPEDFAPHLDAEANRAMQLYAEEKIREIYSRVDGKGAVIVIEAGSEAEARERLRSLPLARLDMLRFEIFGVKPYRGFVAGIT